jgi:peptide/nickel transport system ATP-binding protein
VLALLGESGSGKSVTLRSILGLHPRGNTRVTGEVLLKGHDVNAMSDGERRAYRGRVVSMVFQEPLTALDPVFRIGEQIVETLVRHRAMAHARRPPGAGAARHRPGASPERVLGATARSAACASGP